MGLAGQNQVRQMYVGTNDTTNTTVEDLRDNAAAGNLIVLSADGSAVAAGKDFKVFQKDTLGSVIASDVIKPETVVSAKSVEYSAATDKVVTIDDFTLDANALYTVKIEISQHGSLSQEDTYLKQASVKAAASVQATVDALVVALNRNFGREVGATWNETTQTGSNPYFSFARTGSGATSALTITGKAYTNGFDGDKKIKVYSDFEVSTSSVTALTVETTTAADKGVGTGYQVVEMEHYLLGERTGQYRTMGYPFNIVGPGLNATVGGSYDFIEISYSSEGRDEAKKSKKQLTLALPSLTPSTATDALIANLNTILGAGTIATFGRTE